MNAELLPQHISRDILETLIPHKGKMFLLSRITAHNTGCHTITAEYDITPSCIFYDTVLGGVPSWVSFEFIAQSISAITGIQNHEKGIPARAGFILSLMDFKAVVPVFKNGTTVRIEACQDYSTGAVYKYTGAVFCSPFEIEPAVTTTVTVMETDTIADYNQ